MRLLSMMKRKLYDVLVTAIKVWVIILISNKATVQATRYKRFKLTATDGSFSSPNYPRPYPNNIYYEWILPITSQRLQLEFITFDVYRCYVPRHRRCEAFDFVYIRGNESYCNWNRPPTIIIQPWTKTAVTFHSSDTIKACRGRGFQAQYKPFLEYETTKKPSLTLAMTTTSYALPRVESDSSSSDSLSFLFLLPLLFISLVLVIVCVYWCCCRRPIAAQQERMPTDAGNGHIHGTPIGEEPIGNAMQNSYHNDVFLTVNLPQDQRPQQRAESNNAIAQNGPPSTQTVQTHDERIGCSHESLNMPADEYPPPSYDDVWDENLDLENFDCPPSYEAVMRQSRLDQAAESADLQRNRGTHESPGRLNLETNLGEGGEIVI